MKRNPSPWRVVGVSFFISLVLTAGVLLMTEDVFRLVGKEETVTVIIPEEADGKAVSHILGENGLLRFPFLYRLYADFRSWNDQYLAGEFTLDRAMGYDELRYMLSPKKGVREQIRVTIPEGFTTDEIISLFVSRGIGTEEGFREAIETGGDFGYDFLASLSPAEGRIYRLDGYLFPDTYFVYADSSETEILTKLLSGFDRKFDKSLRAEAVRLGFTVDEIVTLASIIQGEARFSSDMSEVSSVFHNRLISRAFPCLQSDATVKYAKESAGNVEALSAEDLDTIESPYNTYKQKGLPPGAICSPGEDAIRAAIFPADTDYYYFVSKEDGTTIFSRTYAEHRRAVASLRS